VAVPIADHTHRESVRDQCKLASRSPLKLPHAHAYGKRMLVHRAPAILLEHGPSITAKGNAAQTLILLTAALGLGNGAVFKLVPQYFPKETGTVTGLIGAFGGLGGFFPPLELGLIKDATGSYSVGFVLLSAFALVCLAVNYITFVRNAETRPVEIPT
jgi:nitrate/nitrite transporter NarK